MLQYFRLPEDIYFWGQDRYGALVPLLGQVPFRLLGINSLVSESITHFLVLVLGFLALSSFIKERRNRIIFAVAWFFPAIYYTDLLRNVFGLQYSLTGILFFFIKYYDEKFSGYELDWPRKLIWLLIILFILIMAFWVSELSASIILSFIIIFIINYIRKNKIKKLLWKPELYFSIFALLLTYLVIFSLKKLNPPMSIDQFGNSLLNSFPGIIMATDLLLSSLVSIFTFQVPEFLFSIYSWMIIVLIVLLFINRRKIKVPKNELPWILLFVLDIVILIGTVICSEWALNNGMPRRYFIGVHISFWLAFLMIICHIEYLKTKKLIFYIALATVVIGSVSTIYQIGVIQSGSFQPKAKLAKEFTRLGKTGIISNYWNSYSNSFAEPAMIKATPYELSYSVRNYTMVDSVFQQPRIFLVKDMWLEDFPGQIIQFDRTLIRKGSAFFIAGCTVNEYTIKRNWEFNARDLKYQPDLLVYDKMLDKEVIKVGMDFQNSIYKYLVYGPYLTLLPGKYEAVFSLRVDSLLIKDRDIASLDVASEYGKTKLAQFVMKSSVIQSTGEFYNYKLEFALLEKCTTLEFRIYYFGNAILTFDQVCVRSL